MDANIDGDDGPAVALPVARPRRAYRQRPVQAVGSMALFVMVISLDPTSWFRNSFRPVDEALVNYMRTYVIDHGPSVVGVSLGRHELLNLPIRVEEEALRKLRSKWSKASKTELIAWVVYRSFAWAMIDGDPVPVPANRHDLNFGFFGTTWDDGTHSNQVSAYKS